MLAGLHFVQTFGDYDSHLCNFSSRKTVPAIPFSALFPAYYYGQLK